MKKVICIVSILFSIAVNAQKTQIIEYGYNLRGELHLIIQAMDTLVNFYDASGNRITESQNIWSIPDPKDPEKDHFLSCYPNPTGDRVTIAFTLPDVTDYKITLFNQAGQFHHQIISEERAIGPKEIDATFVNLPTGIYYILFQSREISVARKIIRM